MGTVGSSGVPGLSAADVAFPGADALEEDAAPSDRRASCSIARNGPLKARARPPSRCASATQPGREPPLPEAADAPPRCVP